MEIFLKAKQKINEQKHSTLAKRMVIENTLFRNNTEIIKSLFLKKGTSVFQ